MNYTITKGNLHIVDSYKVPKARFEGELAKIKALHPQSDVWLRSMRSLRREWVTHNLCYALHIYRSHTADVDLSPEMVCETHLRNRRNYRSNLHQVMDLQ